MNSIHPAKRPKITLVGHEAALDLILTGRPRSLASILQRRYEVELVTPIFPYNPVKQYDLSEVPVVWRSVQSDGYPKFFSDAKNLISAIQGDIIYALKPRPASFGLALLSQRRLKRPVLLDVDDWEKSMCYPFSKYWPKNVLFSLPRLRQPNSYIPTVLTELLVKKADALTCVSSFFQKCYGGVILPNGCDTALYDPTRFDREVLRREKGVENYKVLMFPGTVQPHKGMSQLLEALELVNHSQVRLVIVGPKTPAVEKLLDNPRVLYWGFYPPSQIPQLLALADLVVLPQIKSDQARGQMPLKLFQAMSMALPVLSTPQADIAEVLEGCGLIAPSTEPADLAEKIQFLLDHPDEARELGQLARQKCLEFYSWDAMEQILDKLITPLL